MKFALKTIRKVKANLLRFKCHLLLEPFANFLLNMVQISRLSRWVRQTPMPEFNDFYAKHHDYDKRYKLYDYIIASEKLEKIYYIEFGVAQGHSFKWWVKHVKDDASRFVGFDTFTGLPEDWGYFKKGDMSAASFFPDIEDRRCRFVKGIFQETLPGFLADFKTDLRKVIHMDADVYSSTLFALTTMGPFMNQDDILIFDEFNVPLHEFKAFSEFVNSYGVKVKVLGAVNNFHQIAFKITENLSSLKN